MLSIGSSATASVLCKGFLFGSGRHWSSLCSPTFGLAASDRFDFSDGARVGLRVSEVVRLEVRRWRVIVSAGEVAVETRRR